MTAALVTLLLLAAGDQPAPPQTDTGRDTTQERQRQEDVAVLARAKAKQLDVRVTEEGGGDAVKASFHGEPLLRWSNPTAGSVYGEVFVWHVEGRPVAAASIFRWYHPYKDASLEIVSLSPRAVSAREGDVVEWECRSAGVSFRAAAEVAAPATTRGGRMSQMRSLARRFEADLKDARGGEPIARKLRLLGQPIHRYESPKQGVIDGALFALAEVTDPELLIMVEASKEKEVLKWRYALARMNNHEIAVRLDGQLVKTYEHIDRPWEDRQSSYTLFSFKPESVKTDSPKQRTDEPQELPKAARP